MESYKCSIVLLFFVFGSLVYGAPTLTERNEIKRFGGVVKWTKPANETFTGSDKLSSESYTFTHQKVASYDEIYGSGIVYYDQTADQMTYKDPNTNKLYVIIDISVPRLGSDPGNENNLSLLDVEGDSLIVINAINARHAIRENCVDHERGIIFVRIRGQWNGTAYAADVDTDAIIAINVTGLLAALNSGSTSATLNPNDFITQVAVLPTLGKFDEGTENTTSEHARDQNHGPTGATMATCTDMSDGHRIKKNDNVGEGLLYDHGRRRLLVGASDITRRAAAPSRSILYSIDVSSTPNFSTTVDARTPVNVFEHDIINGVWFKHLAINPWDPNIIVMDNYAGKDGVERMADGTQYNTLAENNSAGAPSCITYLDFTNDANNPYVIHVKSVTPINSTPTYEGWYMGFTHFSFCSKDEIITCLRGRAWLHGICHGYASIMNLDLSYRSTPLSNNTANNTYWVGAKSEFHITKEVAKDDGIGTSPKHITMSPDKKFIVNDYINKDSNRVELYLWYMNANGKMHCIMIHDDIIIANAADYTGDELPEIHAHAGFIDNTRFVYCDGDARSSSFEKEISLVEIPSTITSQKIIPMTGKKLHDALLMMYRGKY